jgi:hypothetical protein
LVRRRGSSRGADARGDLLVTALVASPDAGDGQRDRLHRLVVAGAPAGADDDGCIAVAPGTGPAAGREQNAQNATYARFRHQSAEALTCSGAAPTFAATSRRSWEGRAHDL